MFDTWKDMHLCVYFIELQYKWFLLYGWGQQVWAYTNSFAGQPRAPRLSSHIKTHDAANNWRWVCSLITGRGIKSVSPTKMLSPQNTTKHDLVSLRQGKHFSGAEIFPHSLFVISCYATSKNAKTQTHPLHDSFHTEHPHTPNWSFNVTEDPVTLFSAHESDSAYG